MSNLNVIDTILFDLDGTLIDSAKIIIKGYLETLKKHNLKNLLDDDSVILGLTLDKAFAKYVKSDEEYEMLVDTYRKYTSIASDEKLELHYYAAKIIKYLKDKGYLVGIITSKSLKAVKRNLEKFNLEDIFDIIVTSEDTKEHKPSATPILYALEKLGKNCNNAIYIGDHENDIKAAKGALVKSGLVKYSYRYEEALKEKPDYIFETLKDIENIF